MPFRDLCPAFLIAMTVFLVGFGGMKTIEHYSASLAVVLVDTLTYLN